MKCQYCGRDYQSARHNQKYCSAKCRNAAKYQDGEYHPKPNDPKFNKVGVCIMCGKKFQRHFTGERFCSDECRYSSSLYRTCFLNYGAWFAK